MVITTKLGGLCIFSHAQGWWERQLVISCLILTGSVKPRGHKPVRTGSMDFEPGTGAMALKALPAGLSRLDGSQCTWKSIYASFLFAYKAYVNKKSLLL